MNTPGAALMLKFRAFDAITYRAFDVTARLVHSLSPTAKYLNVNGIAIATIT